jgi:transcriptional regulator with XRE-family HTH domain
VKNFESGWGKAVKGNRQKPLTFGKVIADARRGKGLFLKECAALIKKEDGQPISFQYLNDIEHDRRLPSSDHIIEQLAENLDIPQDLLYHLARKFPSDLNEQVDVVQILAAWRAFREKLTPKAA